MLFIKLRCWPPVSHNLVSGKFEIKSECDKYEVMRLKVVVLVHGTF